MPKKSPLLRLKAFPTNYPDDAVQILKAMSFGGNLQIVGSMSLRSQQYAGDYDGYEVVECHGPKDKALHGLREAFQSIVRRLRKMPNVYLGDIKAGVVEEWRVLPVSANVKKGKVVGYNYKNAIGRVKALLEKKVITGAEAKEATSLLKPHPTPLELLKAKQSIKFHILRWSPHEVLANALKLRDGSTITLEEAFDSPGITKLDVIGWVQNNRFTDFSVIYEFRHDGKALNAEPLNIADSLRNDLLLLNKEGQYFKALKRRFALAKYKGQTSVIANLTPLLNSDLGRLYHIVGDISTLLDLLENPSIPMKEVRFEIEQFVGRLANIYAVEEYIRKEPAILKDIHHILKLPKERMSAPLESLRDKLDDYLQKATMKAVGKKELRGGTFLPYRLVDGMVNSNATEYGIAPRHLEKNLRILAHKEEKGNNMLNAFGLRTLADDVNEVVYGEPTTAEAEESVRKHAYYRNKVGAEAFNRAIKHFMTTLEPTILEQIRKYGFREDARRKAVESLGWESPAVMKYKDIDKDPKKYAP